MGWRIMAVDTVSGLPFVHNLPVEDDWQAGDSLTAFGEGTFRVRTRDPETPLSLPQIRMLGRGQLASMIVVEWVSEGAFHPIGYREVLFAGFVTGRKRNPKTGVWEVRTRTLRHLAGQRFLAPVIDWWLDDASNWRFNDRTIGRLTHRVTRRAMGAVAGPEGVDDPQWQLPIRFAGRDEGPEGTYLFPKRSRSLENILEEIQGYENGPDIYFEPEWRNGRLAWAMWAAKPINLWEIEPHLDFHPDAETAVEDLWIDTDFLEQTSGVIVQGNGTGESQLVAVAQNNLSHPREGVWTERLFSGPNLESAPMVDSTAREYSHTFANPTEQWSFSIETEGVIDPSRVRPGVTVRLPWPGDELDPTPREKLFTIISASWNSSRRVGIEIQEI